MDERTSSSYDINMLKSHEIDDQYYKDLEEAEKKKIRHENYIKKRDQIMTSKIERMELLNKRKAERLLGQIESNQIIDGVGSEHVTDYIRSLNISDYHKVKMNKSGFRSALRSGDISWQKLGSISKKCAKCLLDPRLLAKEKESIDLISKKVIKNMEDDAQSNILRYFVHKKIRDQEALMKSLNDQRRVGLERMPHDQYRKISDGRYRRSLGKSRSDMIESSVRLNIRSKDDGVVDDLYTTFNMTGVDNMRSSRLV